MPHAQQITLDAIAACIAAVPGVALAGGVYVDRVDPLQPEQLPCVCIDEDGPETVDTLGGIGDGFTQRRTLNVKICAVIAANAPASVARQNGLLIEQGLYNNAPLQTLMSGYEIVSSDYEQSGANESLYNQRVQRWQFTYTTRSNDPSKLI